MLTIKNPRLRALCAGVIAALSIPLLTSPLSAALNIIETSKMRLVYYGAAQSYIVKHTGRCFHNSLAFHEGLFNFHPSEKTTVAVYDPADFGNAGAGSTPWNAITLGIAPPSYAFETTPANERINATMHHEIVHLAASDKTTGRDRFFRGCFGGKVYESADHPETILYSYLTSPRRSAPRWYHEGIAVFLETWMSGGLGRALSSYDEMVFRTAIRDSAELYDVVALESEGTKVDFQIGAMSYLYGGRFMSYMALTESPEKVVDWVSRTEGSKGYFSSQFKHVFGRSLGSSWREWLKWEKLFEEKNLAAIRQYPITPLCPVINHALGSVSEAQYDARRRALYVAVNYPGQVGHIAAIRLDDGHMEKICEIKGAALYFVSSLAYDSIQDVIFYTTDNNGWRDLRMVDIKTGHNTTLMKDGRVGDLSFNNVDSSLWGVRHYNGITTVVRIPLPYTQWNQVYSWPYGRDIYGLDISPDGRYLTAGLSEVNGDQHLVRIEADALRKGDTVYTVIYDFHNSIPANFTHSADGRYIYGTSYVSGVSNIFRYDFAAGQMEAMSNVETGLFNALPLSNDTLVAFEHTAKGFRPVTLGIHPIEDIAPISFLGQQIVENHPIVKSWMAGSPGDVNIDSLTTYSGPYHGFSQMRIAALYPVVEGYQDITAYGVKLELRDPLSQHRIALSGSYSPTRALSGAERWHAEGRYERGKWELSGAYNDADFYDLFGPTKSSRKGYSLGLKYSGVITDDAPKSLKFTLSGTRYGDLEKLPEYQNITTSFDRFLSVSSSLSYTNLRASLGAVDHEKGESFRLGTENKFVNGNTFTRLTAEGAWGIALPLDHSALWLRGYGGYSPDRREEPLANFYFGGFGNNWVDHLNEKRFRGVSSFPGIELNELGGNRYVRGMVEWVVPPLRFKHVGGPAFYLTWARPILFASTIITNPDDGATRRRVANVGGQFDLRMVALSRLNLTLSFGYAVAKEEGYRNTNEFMASLKIL